MMRCVEMWASTDEMMTSYGTDLKMDTDGCRYIRAGMVTAMKLENV